MKITEITAYNGIGKDKVFAGKRDEKQPETVDEARQLWGDDDLLEYAWSSRVIEVQRQIRTGTTMSAKAQLAALEAYARQNPESEVAKTLALLKEKGAGAVEPPKSEGGDAGEKKPEAPTPPPTPEKAAEEPTKEPEPEKAPEKAPARGRRR